MGSMASTGSMGPPVRRVANTTSFDASGVETRAGTCVRDAPVIPVKRVRYSGHPARSSKVQYQRQGWRIMQSCMTLDDSLP